MCTNYFPFASGGTIHVTPTNVYQCSHSFLRPQSLRRQKHRVCLRRHSACADAIQTGAHRLKMLILLSQKFHTTNIPCSEKWGKWTFLTLLTNHSCGTTAEREGRRNGQCVNSNYSYIFICKYLPSRAIRELPARGYEVTNTYLHGLHAPGRISKPIMSAV